MAKRVVAAMDINHNTELIKTGDVIDPKQFTKEQLTRLYERGAVKIEDSKPKQEETEPTMDDFERETAELTEKEKEALAKKEAAAAKEEAAAKEAALGQTKDKK